MQVPAVPVLPEGRLRPVEVVNKFKALSLAGLGYEGEMPGDWGIPEDWFQIPTDVTPTTAGTIDTSARDVATINLVTQLARMGFSLAQIAAMQPGTVVQTGPGGTATVLRQSGAGQAPVPVTLFGGGVSASAAATPGASLAIAAAVAVGALFLFTRGR